MQLQREYTRGNIIHHLLPEYLTSVVGVVLLSFIFGWLPGAIVVSIRTVMFVIYCAQKGEDFTHAPTKRINANRSLIFVGPNYHALHHVYVNQHYSSFVNIFDLVCGTNCQIKDRRFLVTGAHSEYGAAMMAELQRRGGVVDTTDCSSSNLREKLDDCDVLVLAEGSDRYYSTIETFRTLGKDRLVPPEVWAAAAPADVSLTFRNSPDVIYRQIAQYGRAKLSLFFITRGFNLVP